MQLSSAVEEYRQRGFDDLHRGSFSSAHHFFTQAIDVARSDAERSMLYIDRAALAVAQRSSTTDIAMLPSLVLRAESHLHVTRAAYHLISHYLQTGSIERAGFYVRRMLTSAEQLGDSLCLAMAFDGAAGVESARWNLPQALVYARRAVDHLERCVEDAPLIRGMIIHNYGYSLLVAGCYTDAIAPLVTGVQHMTSSGCATHFTREAYLHIAFAHLATGMLDEASETIDLARNAYGDDAPPLVHYLAGEIEQRRGRLASSREHFERLREHYPDFEHIVDILSAVDILPMLLPE